MTNTNFMPATPWHVEQRHDLFAIYPNPATETGSRFPVGEVRFAAAAQIMAAAPDLLAALVAMRDAFQDACDTHIYSADDDHPDDCCYCAAVAQADAAIAKARGEG